MPNLNTRTIGAVGVAGGALTIAGAATRLIGLLSDPTYLTALYNAAMDSRRHMTSRIDVATYMQLNGALIALVGAVVLALIAANVGKNVFAKDSPANGGANGGVSATNQPSPKGK